MGESCLSLGSSGEMEGILSLGCEGNFGRKWRVKGTRKARRPPRLETGKSCTIYLQARRSVKDGDKGLSVFSGLNELQRPQSTDNHSWCVYKCRRQVGRDPASPPSHHNSFKLREQKDKKQETPQDQLTLAVSQGRQERGEAWEPLGPETGVRGLFLGIMVCSLNFYLMSNIISVQKQEKEKWKKERDTYCYSE